MSKSKHVKESTKDDILKFPSNNMRSDYRDKIPDHFLVSEDLFLSFPPSLLLRWSPTCILAWLTYLVADSVPRVNFPPNECIICDKLSPNVSQWPRRLHLFQADKHPKNSPCVVLSPPDCSVSLCVSSFGLRHDKKQPADWNKLPPFTLRR